MAPSASHPVKQTNATMAAKAAGASQRKGNNLMPPPQRSSQDIRKRLRRQDAKPSIFIPRRRPSSVTTRPSSYATSVFDDTDELNSLATVDDRFGQVRALNFSGPGVRPQRDGKYLTKSQRRTELTDNTLARITKNLHVDGTDLLRNRYRGGMRSGTSSHPELGRLPKEPGTAGSGLRSEYDLSKNEGATSIDPTRDVYENAEKPDDDNAADLYCACRSKKTDLMVPCQTCGAHFHPGCIGKGSYDRNDYLETSESRESCFRADLKHFTQGKRYTCSSCDEKFEEAKRSLETGMTERRRRHLKREQTSLLKEQRQRDAGKMEKTYQPFLAVKKRIALRKATTDTEREDIEFDHAFARAMGVTEDDDDDGWGVRPSSPEDLEEREVVRNFDTYKEVRELQKSTGDTELWIQGCQKATMLGSQGFNLDRERENRTKVDKAVSNEGKRSSTRAHERPMTPLGIKRKRGDDSEGGRVSKH